MIHAAEHLRAMRGGAQSHLIRGSDRRYYVVKFRNNPQGAKILANEFLAAHIAQILNLPVPPCKVMEVSEEFIRADPTLVLHVRGDSIPVAPGPAFASELPTSLPTDPVYDYLPSASLALVENLTDFAGMLALDKWLCNCDGRQTIYCRPRKGTRMRVYFIDQGFCFNADEWSFPDTPLRGVAAKDECYRLVTGWQSFEPWLSAIEGFKESTLLRIIARIPLEWHGNPKGLVRLVETLIARRNRVRSLIHEARTSARYPFSNWRNDPVAPQPELFSQPVSVP